MRSAITRLPKNLTTVRCACGSVELAAIGAPILCAVCYCDDCQEGARQIEALPNASPVLDPDGGSSLVLYRKDRFERARGAQLLRGYKIREKTVTNRVVATCCNSAMFLEFDRGPFWVSIFRARMQGEILPVQMRVFTRFKPESSVLSSDIPSYPGFPLKFIAKLIAARIAMLFHR